jgi:hypothetical protein
MKEENVIDLLDLGTENLEAMEPEEEELVLDEPEEEELAMEELPIPEGMKKMNSLLRCIACGRWASPRMRRRRV